MKLLRTSHPTLVLLALGLISAAVYAGITVLFPLTLVAGAARPYDLEQLSHGREWAAGFYAVGLLVVFAAFAAAFFVVQRVRRPLATVAGFGFLFALILLWLYPLTAIDVFVYVLQGRQEVIYQQNPMALPVSQVAEDPLLPFAGEWKDVPAPYGPLWIALGSAVVRMGWQGTFDGALAFKGVMAATYGACLLLLIWGAERKVEAVLLFAWNPLVLLQGPGNAHNDLLMITIAALALVLWGKKRWWPAAVLALALAASIKLPALLLGPLLLASILAGESSWRRRVWLLAASALLGASTMLVFYLPYWPPWTSLAGLIEVFATQRSYTLLSLLRLSLSQLGAPSPYDFQIARMTGLVIFFACYLLLLRRVWCGRMGLYTAGFWAFFLYLLTSTSFRIWYPLWVIPPAVLAHAELEDGLLLARMRWRTYLFSLTSELSILMFTLLWRWVLNGVVLPKADWFWMYVLVLPWQFGLPLLAPLLIRRGRDGGTSQGPKAMSLGRRGDGAHGRRVSLRIW